MFGQTGEADATRFQLNEEQDVVGGETSPGEHFDGEEVGTCQDVHVGVNEILPSSILAPLCNEGVEGREWPEGNQSGEAKVRTQSRVALPLNLWRVYAAARRNKQAQFTALMHHVDVVALERAFRRLKQKASAGVDGETVETYEQNLAGNLKDLRPGAPVVAGSVRYVRTGSPIRESCG